MVDGPRRVTNADIPIKDSRIHYPYKDQQWGLGQREASGPLSSIVFPNFQRLPVGSTILDMGGGDGFLVKNAPRAKDRPYAIVSIDQSSDAIARQRKIIENSSDRAEVGDITKVNLGDLKADAAIASRVLHALGPDDQLAVTERVADSLKPGGIFHVSALADTDWKPREAAKSGLPTSGTLVDFSDIMNLRNIGREDPWHAFPFSPDRFHELAEATGLKVVPLVELAPTNGHKTVNPFVVEFTEPTSFPHLAAAHPVVTYYYAALQKPFTEGN